jgi:hypothetical protein
MPWHPSCWIDRGPMFSLYVLPLAAQVLAPVALLIWHATGTSSRSTALLRTSVTAIYLLAIMLAGLWLTIPSIVVIGYLVVLAVQAPAIVQRARGLPLWPRTFSGWVGFTATCVIAFGTSAVMVQAAAGHRPPPEQAVDLEFPLRHGIYVVANGGSNDLVNAHVQTLAADRFRDYRGQSYGIDIVAVNRLGVRASTLAARDLERYVIFGQAIYAPCSGVVLRAEDGHPDMAPPQPDREHMPGNFVFMDCSGVHVLLGHMKQGTVRVRPGDIVRSDVVVGQVGNSGNTNEPHLHMHAQRPAKTDAFLSGDPLPVVFNGRFLARNSRIAVR